MIELIREPWPWYVSGPLIAAIMIALLFFGKSFGLSGNLRTMCTIIGADKVSDFFKIDIKQNLWNLMLLIGIIAGGYIAATYLSHTTEIDLNPDTITYLSDLGLTDPGGQLMPESLFASEHLTRIGHLIFLISGGFLVGFGARYAGGCTSGHAISGMSDMQWPSLLAVVGFFIGGLTMTHFLLPVIIKSII